MNIRSLSLLVALLVALSQPAFAGGWGFLKPAGESTPVTTDNDKPTADVPEPGSFFLLAAGLAAFAFTRRKK